MPASTQSGGLLRRDGGGKPQDSGACPAETQKVGPGHCPVQEGPHGRAEPSKRRERLYSQTAQGSCTRYANVRNDAHHKATTAIAKSAGRVVIEDLNVSSMMRNRRLARALADAGLSGFLAKLACKCRWYGAELVAVSRWFPSSKLCAQCGDRNDSLTLSDRRWVCPNCGAENGRDLNAALNLKQAGFELPGAGRGDRVRPATPAMAVEASRESMRDIRTPAKPECQILNSGQVRRVWDGRRFGRYCRTGKD